MYQGLKQGSPLRGQLFVATLGEKLQALQEKWRREKLGIWIDTVHLSQLLFADDLVLLGRDGAQIQRMLSDLETALWELGLAVNPEKPSYVYGPHSQHMKESVAPLSGEDLSCKGTRILGQDMRAKQLRSWSQYHCYKSLCRSHATFKKRFAHHSDLYPQCSAVAF